MTWTAPEPAPVTDALNAPERETLTSFLHSYRSGLLHKCAGLTGEQPAGQTTEPSNLSLLGRVRHITKVERTWFRERFAGQDLRPMYDPAKGEDSDFEDLAPERAEEDYARLLEEIRLGDEVIAAASLDDTFVHRGEKYSLRLIHVHLIAEYARHAGHADLLRERLDGVTGSRNPYDSQPKDRSWGRAGGLNRRVRVTRTV